MSNKENEKKAAKAQEKEQEKNGTADTAAEKASTGETSGDSTSSKAPKGKKDKDSNSRIAQLEAELKAAQEKIEKEHNDYLRLMAEFETFRRRSSEDRLNMISSASAETIKGLLPVLDDCERALQLLEQSADEAAREGTNLIYTKLLSYLKTKGLEIIEAKGAPFDTDFHEAVTQFPTPDESMKGKVIDVVQTGYTLSGKVLRYAKVVVGA